MRTAVEWMERWQVPLYLAAFVLGAGIGLLGLLLLAREATLRVTNVDVSERACAMARQTGAMALKSASMPPRVSMSSEKWVSTSPREPAATALLTAWVWVMDRLTAQRNTSEFFMASATGRGGS